ncbi:uncharacterized protein L969DRAFT_14400 [Mixia osmundae IAM 14324]|uniref:CBM21 domain-containing protein n=1 Tax=Mixia osmundae (strain CBS 9802 / IAM 14324 / JCM 22182 / KY 12970) TaxID=764103 RepID=G7E043_MIXOS|nr:uncharacterized protein L969DRAFT_14400 [Mixia osmundae IAM 14324]KEI42195.1 hypothetical protein L969DRAFT_14400 [Mixia osmundae IAM 14324]GAA96203.1 hypothetical protein E5Q_02867 [Mixia osmundae IAM 14324]
MPKPSLYSSLVNKPTTKYSDYYQDDQTGEGSQYGSSVRRTTSRAGSIRSVRSNNTFRDFIMNANAGRQRQDDEGSVYDDARSIASSTFSQRQHNNLVRSSQYGTAPQWQPAHYGRQTKRAGSQAGDDNASIYSFESYKSDAERSIASFHSRLSKSGSFASGRPGSQAGSQWQSLGAVGPSLVSIPPSSLYNGKGRRSSASKGLSRSYSGNTGYATSVAGSYTSGISQRGVPSTAPPLVLPSSNVPSSASSSGGFLRRKPSEPSNLTRIPNRNPVKPAGVTILPTKEQIRQSVLNVGLPPAAIPQAQTIDINPRKVKSKRSNTSLQHKTSLSSVVETPLPAQAPARQAAAQPTRVYASAAPAPAQVYAPKPVAAASPAKYVPPPPPVTPAESVAPTTYVVPTVYVPPPMAVYAPSMAAPMPEPEPAPVVAAPRAVSTPPTTVTEPAFEPAAVVETPMEDETDDLEQCLTEFTESAHERTPEQLLRALTRAGLLHRVMEAVEEEDEDAVEEPEEAIVEEPVAPVTANRPKVIRPTGMVAAAQEEPAMPVPTQSIKKRKAKSPSLARLLREVFAATTTKPSSPPSSPSKREPESAVNTPTKSPLATSGSLPTLADLTSRSAASDAHPPATDRATSTAAPVMLATPEQTQAALTPSPVPSPSPSYTPSPANEPEERRGSVIWQSSTAKPNNLLQMTLIEATHHSASRTTLHGHITVRPDSHIREISVRSTTNYWATYLDSIAQSSSSGTWVFDRAVEHAPTTLQLAIRYILDGSDAEHWDSNGGQNYHVYVPADTSGLADSAQVSTPTQVEAHTPVSVVATPNAVAEAPETISTLAPDVNEPSDTRQSSPALAGSGLTNGMSSNTSEVSNRSETETPTTTPASSERSSTLAKPIPGLATLYALPRQTSAPAQKADNPRIYLTRTESDRAAMLERGVDPAAPVEDHGREIEVTSVQPGTRKLDSGPQSLVNDRLPKSKARQTSASSVASSVSYAPVSGARLPRATHASIIAASNGLPLQLEPETAERPVGHTAQSHPSSRRGSSSGEDSRGPSLDAWSPNQSRQGSVSGGSVTNEAFTFKRRSQMTNEPSALANETSASPSPVGRAARSPATSAGPSRQASLHQSPERSEVDGFTHHDDSSEEEEDEYESDEEDEQVSALPNDAMSTPSVRTTGGLTTAGIGAMSVPLGAYRPARDPKRISYLMAEKIKGPAQTMCALTITSNAALSLAQPSFVDKVFASPKKQPVGAAALPPHLAGKMNSGPLVELTNLAESPKKLKTNQVLVQVFAVAVDFWDQHHVNKLGQNPNSHGFIPGRSFCGKAVEVGMDVTRIKKGDFVYGLAELKQSGALAEYLTVDRGLIAHAPQGRLSLEQIAALPLAGVAAYQAMNEVCADLPRGSKILVLNAHEGVGAIAVQLAISLRQKADLWITAQVPEYVTEAQTFCRAIGASETLQDEPLAVINSLHESSYDVVIDTIGGRRIYDASRRILHSQNSTFITTVGESLAVASTPSYWKMGFKQMRRAWVKKGSKRINYLMPSLDEREDCREALDRLRVEVDRRHLSPVVRRVLGFEEGGKAFEDLVEENLGGIVIRILD